MTDQPKDKNITIEQFWDAMLKQREIDFKQRVNATIELVEKLNWIDGHVLMTALSILAQRMGNAMTMATTPIIKPDDSGDKK